MAVTLEEIQKNTQDDIQAGVIDEFRKSSYLFQQMPFDNAVTPGSNQGTLTYGYTRLKTQPTAATRKFNADYTPQMVTKERVTTDLAVWGGSFTIDRVFQDVGGLVDELALQTTQKVKAVRAKFNDLAINGIAEGEEAEASEFQGLDEILAGSSTEHNAGASVDWTGVDTQAKAFAVAEEIDEWLSLLQARPTAILGNRKAIARLKAIGRFAGSFTQTQDGFGQTIDNYDGIPLIDLGDKSGSSETVIPTETRTIGESEVSGLTDLYAPQLSMEGFHGITLKDAGTLIRSYLDEFQPGYRQSGTVRTGEIEMVGGIALKATKAAGVFRNIKVA
jgi:hypothetical protein